MKKINHDLKKQKIISWFFENANNIWQVQCGEGEEMEKDTIF